jgi:hypothetical protein
VSRRSIVFDVQEDERRDDDLSDSGSAAHTAAAASSDRFQGPSRRSLAVRPKTCYFGGEDHYSRRRAELEGGAGAVAIGRGLGEDGWLADGRKGTEVDGSPVAEGQGPLSGIRACATRAGGRGETGGDLGDDTWREIGDESRWQAWTVVVGEGEDSGDEKGQLVPVGVEVRTGGGLVGIVPVGGFGLRGDRGTAVAAGAITVQEIDVALFGPEKVGH